MQSNETLDRPEVLGQPSDPRDRLASQGKRFANSLIDGLAIYGLAFIAGMLLGVTGNVEIMREPMMPNLIGFLLVMCYYIIAEGFFGRTIGKAVTRTRVVDASGGPPSFGQVVGRSFSRLIPFEAFSFLANPVGWHDSISGTYVINE
jgi:uncharacterized RDD family membrane protein YckC